MCTRPKTGIEGLAAGIAALRRHRRGNGFDLVIYDQLTVSGRIVCTERKDAPETTAPATE